jgi:hypothetical protein
MLLTLVLQARTETTSAACVPRAVQPETSRPSNETARDRQNLRKLYPTCQSNPAWLLRLRHEEAMTRAPHPPPFGRQRRPEQSGSSSNEGEVAAKFTEKLRNSCPSDDLVRNGVWWRLQNKTAPAVPARFEAS